MIKSPTFAKGKDDKKRKDMAVAAAMQKAGRSTQYANLAFLGSTSASVPMAKPRKYEPEPEDEGKGEPDKKEKTPEEQAAEEANAEGSVPADDQAAHGDENMNEEQVAAEEGPPEGHEDWLKHYEYAHAHGTHPLAYGMAQDYVSRMQQEAEQQQPEHEETEEEKQAREEAEAQNALEGGSEQMPEPQGDKEENPVQAQYGLASAMPAGMGGAALGAGIGSLVPGLGTAAGAAIGGGGAALGGLTLQNANTPVTYAAVNAVIQPLLKEVAGLKKTQTTVNKEREQERAALIKLMEKAAVSDVKLKMYQLGELGVVGTADEQSEQYQAIANHLLSLDEDTREAKFTEIATNWAKDEAVAYQRRGAPIGDFLQLAQQEPAPRKDKNGKPMKKLPNEEQTDQALAYLRSPEGKEKTKGMDHKAAWATCLNYAMNGEQVVTG